MPVSYAFLPFKGVFEFVLVPGSGTTPPSGGCKIQLISGDNLLLQTGDALLKVACVTEAAGGLLYTTGDNMLYISGDNVLKVA